MQENKRNKETSLFKKPQAIEHGKINECRSKEIYHPSGRYAVDKVAKPACDNKAHGHTLEMCIRDRRTIM